MAFEIAHDLGRHSDGDAVDRLTVGHSIEKLERIHEAQDDDVDRRRSVAAIDQPMVLRVEVVDAPALGPNARVVAAMPDAVHLQTAAHRRSAIHTWRRWRRLNGVSRVGRVVRGWL